MASRKSRPFIDSIALVITGGLICSVLLFNAWLAGVIERDRLSFKRVQWEYYVEQQDNQLHRLRRILPGEQR